MTWTGRGLLAAISLAGASALGGCAYDDGYYGGVSVGTGYYGGGYYDNYGGPGYYSPGYYSGWYNDFYYPGSGYYVYDRGGRRQRWNDGQRRYWEGRREARRPDDRRNWDGGQRQWRGDRNGQGDRNVQGDRGNWQGRWRDRDANAAPATPPVTQSEPGATTPRAGWGRRSDGARWRGNDGPDRDDRSRGDGRRDWRR
ncbi:hypothetical protein [Sphingobium mellinum]|uniref:hypothetical protein n=1 Tax=Sphingobium mellinum TaxID=1387166 RepID=UPI0030EC2AC1